MATSIGDAPSWTVARCAQCVTSGTQTGPNPTDRAKRGRNAADRGVGRCVCSAIAGMTRRPSGTACARVTSCRRGHARTTRRSGPRAWRWIVDRTFAWLNQFRRF